MKYKLILIVTVLFSFYNCFAQNDTAAIRLKNYLNKVSFLFYKCSSKDNEISNSIKEKKVNEIESGRTALLQYATEGMKELNTMESFDSDPSLKFDCRETLLFYKQLAESDLSQVRDFFVIEENFLKIKNEFEKKPARKHSQSEINAYNNQIKIYSAALIRYEQLNNFMANSRKQILYNWNASQKLFMDVHTTKH